MSEQAVIIHFDYGQADLSPLYELEDKLIAAIEAADAGEFDGNEVAVDTRIAVRSLAQDEGNAAGLPFFRSRRLPASGSQDGG